MYIYIYMYVHIHISLSKEAALQACAGNIARNAAEACRA